MGSAASLGGQRTGWWEAGGQVTGQVSGGTWGTRLVGHPGRGQPPMRRAGLANFLSSSPTWAHLGGSEARDASTHDNNIQHATLAAACCTGRWGRRACWLRRMHCHPPHAGASRRLRVPPAAGGVPCCDEASLGPLEGRHLAPALGLGQPHAGWGVHGGAHRVLSQRAGLLEHFPASSRIGES